MSETPPKKRNHGRAADKAQISLVLPATLLVKLDKLAKKKNPRKLNRNEFLVTQLQTLVDQIEAGKKATKKEDPTQSE
ncbi:MAG: hypothetical protein K0R17_3563 [Rariglobus sp.]|jgi:hypothetical protein|nr:hypothetical protein [Rariglobus sp.]